MPLLVNRLTRDLLPGLMKKSYSAKRYERMMKAHGIHQTQASIRDTPIPSRTKLFTSPPSKKRKFEKSSDDNKNAADDDEGIVPPIKPEPAGIAHIKPEPADVPQIKPEPAGLTIKAEPTTVANEGFMLDSKEQLMTSQPPVHDDGAMFQDFLQAGAFQLEEHEALWITEESDQKRGARRGAMQESILIND